MMLYQFFAIFARKLQVAFEGITKGRFLENIVGSSLVGQLCKNRFLSSRNRIIFSKRCLYLHHSIRFWRSISQFRSYFGSNTCSGDLIDLSSLRIVLNCLNLLVRIVVSTTISVSYTHLTLPTTPYV